MLAKMKILFLLSLCLIMFTLFTHVKTTLQFEILPDRPRCYIEELFKESVMMVKWKIVGVPSTDDEAKGNYLHKNINFILVKQFLQLIQFSISQESNGMLLQRDPAKTVTGKLTFKATEEGQYKVCVNYHGGWHLPHPTYISLKITSDNMDEPNLKTMIKNEDLDPVHEKAREILSEGRTIVNLQKSALESEDDVFQLSIKSSVGYYYMTVIQIVVVVGLGIYQLFNFRKFLQTNNLF